MSAPASEASAQPLEGPAAQLILRYLKYRWVRDVADLLEASRGASELAVDDLDLDTDMVELLRSAGRAALESVAQATLGLEEPPAPESGAARALDPEVAPEDRLAFLRLVGVNLAFRLRGDPLLLALVRLTARRGPLAPDPGVTGALLGRARSVRRAGELLREGGLSGPALEAALQAAPPPALPLAGARLHAEADQDGLESALREALPELYAVPWAQAPLGSRQFVLLRSRGGFTTLLEEGDQPSLELAEALAARLPRLAWARFPAPEEEGAPELVLFERTRRVLDTAGLAAQLGQAPSEDDVAGALRAWGVLDLDPEHSRGPAPLDFATAAAARAKSTRQLAFQPRHRRGPEGA